MRPVQNILFIITLISLFIGCNNDGDDVSALEEVVMLADLEGLWNVVNISGGFPGFDEDFERGDLTWIFNQNTENLIIEAGDNIDPILNTGTFTFSILQSEGRSFLVFDGMEQGHLVLSESNLQLDGSELSNGGLSDAFLISFER